MTYTAGTLIANAYFTSGRVSKDFQGVSGDQVALALNLLNEFLAVKSINVDFIPYYQFQTFNGVVGQEKYFVANLVSIDTLTFYLNSDIRMPMHRMSRNEYFSTARVESINSLPITWRAERTVGGTNIYLYFKPDQAYQFNISGKFSLAAITSISEDLSTYLDLSYISYMRYGLAEMICEFYGIPLQPQTAAKLKQFEQLFRNINPKDYSMIKTTAFVKSDSGWGWGDVLIGHGWRG